MLLDGMVDGEDNPEFFEDIKEGFDLVVQQNREYLKRG